MADLCLTIVFPPSVEEKLLDALLETPGAEVFTSAQVHCHGSGHGPTSAAEQVMGRRRGVQVQVVLATEALDRVVALLNTDFRGTSIRYWATTLVAEGALT